MSSGYQLGIVQEVLLALLAHEPSHPSRVRARLALALGPLAGSVNEGQVYMTLTRLAKAGLVRAEPSPEGARSNRKIYALTGKGHDRVRERGLRTRAGRSPRRPSFTSSWWRRPPPGSPIRSGLSTPSAGSCWPGCARHSR